MGIAGKSPRKVKAADLTDPNRTSGITRLEAFAEGNVWVGAVVNHEARELSKWHVHPNHDTYAYCAEGTMRLDFGPGGAETLMFEVGDFAFIPAGLVHREGNGGDTPSKGLIFRIGEGQVVVDLDGPDPA
jgi:quercetin dioxygenase-like cupin family protein